MMGVRDKKGGEGEIMVVVSGIDRSSVSVHQQSPDLFHMNNIYVYRVLRYRRVVVLRSCRILVSYYAQIYRVDLYRSTLYTCVVRIILFMFVHTIEKTFMLAATPAKWPPSP